MNCDTCCTTSIIPEEFAIRNNKEIHEVDIDDYEPQCLDVQGKSLKMTGQASFDCENVGFYDRKQVRVTVVNW